MTVRERADCLHFTLEPLAVFQVAAVNYFERNFLLRTLISGEIHLRHTSPPEGMLEVVMTECCSFQFQHSSHVSCSFACYLSQIHYTRDYLYVRLRNYQVPFRLCRLRRQNKGE